MNYVQPITLLADTILGWMAPYGRLDPKRCPFVYTETLVSSMNFHAPMFLAVGLYRAAEVLGETRWKEAADRLVVGYLASLRNPQTEPDHYTQVWNRHMTEKFGPDPSREAWALHILTWPFIYGMGLHGYREFRRHNPEELAYDSKASALYEWLNHYRWDQGSYYRNGYGVPAQGIEDCANSDDNCVMGRGLMGYYAITERADVLRDARGLARYYLTECVPGTYQGVWCSDRGAWAVAPTQCDSYEHFQKKKSFETSWGFSQMGSIEFLTELALSGTELPERDEIADKCRRGMAWMFDCCQFESGAVGMGGRDDQWLGITAGAILSYHRVRQAGWLDADWQASYAPRMTAAEAWLLANITPETIATGGYFQITGQSEPRPVDNCAWLLGVTLECLAGLQLLKNGQPLPH